MLSVGSSVSLELKRGCDMEEERLYDYARGINAPYWIQEVKTQKGKRIWYFATPMQLSFFVVFALVLILMLTVLNSILPQGKKMHVFLWDYICYLIDFRFNRKAIYHEDRMKMMDEEEIVFEKTDL